MFEMGFSEMLLIAVVALVVLGPERLPKVARTAGQWLGRLQHFVANIKTDLSTQAGMAELVEAKDGLTAAARQLQQELSQSAQTLNADLPDWQQPPAWERLPRNAARPTSPPHLQPIGLPRMLPTRCRCAAKPCSANAICARALAPARNCGCAAIRYRNKFCMSSPSSAEPQAEPQTLMAHLLELRRRLMWLVLVLLVCFFALMPFAQKLYTFVAQPLMVNLPAGTSMIATDVIAPFFVPVKVTLMVAFLITLPHTLYQVWAFVAPGLYRHEKRLIFPVLFSSIVLFFTGMAFAYFFVFPVVFKFLAGVTPAGVSMATDIDKYLSFVLGMFVAFGVVFETPVVVILLNRMGVVSVAQLQTARAYVIVGAFVVAAIVTPPDVISQTLLAVPLIVLYELGIVCCRLLGKRAASVPADEE